MARKNLTPAERKAQTADLKAALKTINESLKGPEAELKAAEKTLAAAKKDADKSVLAAGKIVSAAQKRAQKARDAHAKGKAKIDEKLAALVPPAAD